MAEDFIIPIGVDSGNFENNLANLINRVDELANKGDKANKSLSDSFRDSTTESEKLDKSIEKTGKTIDETKRKSESLGKGLNKMLKETNKESERFEDGLIEVGDKLVTMTELGKQFGKNMADAYNELDNEKAKAVVNDLVSALSGEIRLSVGEVDQTELNAFVEQIENAKSATGGLVEFIKYAELQLSKLNPNTEEFRELSDAIEVTKVAVDEFRRSTVDSIQTQDKITVQIRRLKDAMYQMAVEGQKDTKVYREMSEELKKLQREVNRTNAEMKSSFSRTPYLDRMLLATQGVVGGFATLQATIALVGGESEDYEKVTKRLVATLTLLQGIQANINFLNQVRQGHLGRLNVLDKLSITNARAYTASLIAQAKAMTLTSVATNSATIATKALRVALASTGIGLIVVAIGYLYENWDKLTKKVNEFLPAGAKISDLFDTIEKYAMGVGKAVVNFVTAPLQGVIDLLTGASFSEAFDNLKGNLNVVQNFEEGYRETRERQNQDHLNKIEQQEIDAGRRRLERMKNRSQGEEEVMEKYYYEMQKLYMREIELRKKLGEDYADVQTEMEDAYDARESKIQSKRLKEIEERNKAIEARAKAERVANEKRKREAERAHQEYLKLLESQREQMRKLNEQIEDIDVSNIANQYDKEIEEIKLATKRKIQAIEEEKALTEEARQKQTDLIVLLREKESAKIQEIEKKRIEDTFKIRQEGYEAMLALLEKSEISEIQKIENDSIRQIELIREKYANEIEIRNALIEMVEAETARKRSEVRKRYQEKELAEEEKRMILMVELSSEYAVKSTNTEIQKQMAILQIRRDFAVKRLEALRESGADENDIELLQLRKLIKDFDTELNSLESEAGKFNLFDFLGIGAGLDDTQRDAIGSAVNTTMSSLKEMSDFMVAQYDRQIQQRQKNIESINQEISAIESQLSQEKKLQEEGYANRADAMEAELRALESKKEQEIAMQEEALEAKKRIQKAQIFADTLVQTTNLITSATEIFKALSGIPFVGVPLAITTIATMFGAFAGAKIKAFQAVNQQTEMFAKGGEIDGKPHSRGGVKYYSPDGSRVKELEGGEFVINKKQTQKYRDLLKSINSDNFTFDISELAKTNSDSKEVQMMFGGTGILESIDKGIKEMNQKEYVSETPTHIIKTKGNTIRRIRK